eukprot:TRINITY_DN9441_c0_g2_i3.p1 TRINITY_DN9441_c0_g2~~TRINITY_DN9441_c0_g2_i3.p1  ORF type:complete len:133 (+),score=19.53 TRINITY_DN9441_c0_g2_i3:961-1359(+)
MDVPCSAIIWVTYENLTRRFVDYFNNNPVFYSASVTRHLIASTSGALSGAFAAAVTNPIALATIRVQVQDQRRKMYRNGPHVLWKMLTEEGVLSIFRGTGARMLGMAPSTGFGFTFFEACKNYARLRPDEIK